MAQNGNYGKIKLAAMAAVAGMTGFNAAAGASTFVWTAASGDWDNTANWSPAGPPTSADRAEWSASSPASSTVELTDDETAGTLHVVDRAVQFNLNDFTLNFSGSDPVSHSGISGHYVKGPNGHAIFNGTGTVNFTGKLIGGYGSRPDYARVTAQAGATVTSQGLQIGAYRGSGIVTLDGADTVWQSSGPLILGLSGAGTSPSAPQPRAQLIVQNGAVFNHTMTGTPASENNRISLASSGGQDTRIEVDGAGSQLNVLGTYNGNVQFGGSSSNLDVEITDGGVLSAQIDLGLSFANGTGVNTFNVSGTGSKFSAPSFTLAGRSNSDAARGPTVVNVGTGGTLEATNSSGTGIGVGDRGRLSLQGGTVSLAAGTSLTLLTSSANGTKAVLEGNGTITGGNVVAQRDTIVQPGLTGAGTIKITGGNFTTQTVGSTAATDLLFELQTTAGNPHDLVAATGVVTIGDDATDDITFSVLGGGNLAAGGSGFMDFLIGGTVNYGGGALGADIPNIDNLDDLLALAGYTRTSSTPLAGQYRYFLTTVGVSDYAGGEYAGLQAVRLEMAAIPEPATLSVLSLAGLALLRRRRH